MSPSSLEECFLLSSLIGILDSPLSCLLYGSIGISLPEVSDLLVQGVVKIGCRKEGLDREENRSDLECGTPLILQDIKTDSACKYAIKDIRSFACKYLVLKRFFEMFSKITRDDWFQVLNLPSLSILGWKILVLKRTLGGTIGYSSGKKSSALKRPPSYGVCPGPAIFTKKWRGLLSLGSA